MATKTKIKIVDNSNLREEIDKLYELSNQIDLAKWAMKCAQHIIVLSKNEELDKTAIENGFRIIELWQTGNATVQEVRKASFEVHKVARLCKSEITESALRAYGHAVGVGHMKEHAMVCSDYAIKAIQLTFPNQMHKITTERMWQLKELKTF